MSTVFRYTGIAVRKTRKLFGTILIRDLANILRFGLDAPRHSQTLFLDPREIRLAMLPDILSRADTGRVIGGDWDQHIRPVNDINKIRMVKARIHDGKTWEDAGAYQIMEAHIQKHRTYDDCTTMDDVVRRYQRLDRIIDAIRTEGFLKMAKIHKGTFRESGGVYVHIGRNGEYIFGIGGCHRLAIAQALQLKRIPVQLGVVHKEAIANGHWNKICRGITPGVAAESYAVFGRKLSEKSTSES